MRPYSLIFSLILSLFTSTITAEEAAETTESPQPDTPPPMVQTDWLVELRADTDKEQIVELPVPGGSPILALYQAQSRGEPRGGLILLHDKGAHPDWPGVINPLRQALPGYGWSTLSIETPELPEEAEQAPYDQLNEKLIRDMDAAITSLNGKNIFNMALIGHGQGAILAAAYLAQRPQNSISGLLLIGMPTPTDIDARFAPLKLLETIQTPILDIYGAQDEVNVTGMAGRREDSARKAARPIPNPGFSQTDRAQAYADLISYRQFEIAGANHNFDGVAPRLIKRCRGWLQRYASGREITVKRP